jgi:1A family penicillin-binding protein
LIYDRNGQLLYEVIGDEGKQTPLALQEIPAACWQATVAVEDSRFFSHPGVDLLAIGRAAWSNWRSGTIVSGASTLTQQLARNTLMTPEERFETSLRRKVREAWLALQIELRYSKEEILVLYLNQVYYGNFAYGLEAAAQAYYGKSAPELDLAECSLLAGLLQNPAVYNPLQNLEAARYRQSTVLSLMALNGYITRPDAELALAENLRFAASPFTIEAPHFVSYVETQLEQMMLRLHGDDGAATPPDLTGLRVYTTLDLYWQREAAAIVARRLEQLRQDKDAPDNRRVDNAAVVALDPQTGAIRTMVGSPDYFDASIDGAVNAAVALRQPGSAIKPITYAAALDPQAAAPGLPLTAATVIADVRTTFVTAEGEPYVPENYDRAWHGPVSVRTALASSYNVPAVKVLQTIGIDGLIDQARRQGITTFRVDGTGSDASAPYGLALTLGGGEVSLVELTGAYAAFANGGYRVEPYAIERVEDVEGKLVWQANGCQVSECQVSSSWREATTDCSLLAAHCSLRTPDAPRVLNERVAYLITDILSDDDARAPSFGRGSVLRLDRPAAVKTGTTTDWRDNWTVGYTPDLVTGVWVGNADNTPMLGVSGVSGAGPIWHDFMTMAHRNAPVRSFAQPQGLVRAAVCVDSGLLPTQWCARRRSELFIVGTEPAEFDTVYRPVAVDLCQPGDTPRLVDLQTPLDCIAERVYRVYPPELAEWAQANHIPQPPPVVGGDRWTVNGEQRAGTEVAARQPTGERALMLALTSPDPNGVYRLSDALPADVQQVRLAVHSADQWQGVTFYVNGEAVGSAVEAPFETWWSLQRGSHQISAVAEDVAGQRIAAEPIWIEVR